MTPSVRTGLDVLRARGLRPAEGQAGRAGHPPGRDRRQRRRPAVPHRRRAVRRRAGRATGRAVRPGARADRRGPGPGRRRGGTATRGPAVPVHSLYGDTFDSLQPTAGAAPRPGRAGDRPAGRRQPLLHVPGDDALLPGGGGGGRAAGGRPRPAEPARRRRRSRGRPSAPGFESFVGPHPIATRHGMTIGELARLYQAERVPDVDLTVVPCEGWRAVARCRTRPACRGCCRRRTCRRWTRRSSTPASA